MSVAVVVLEIILFWVVAVGILVGLWRFARRYNMTTLTCPDCGGNTPRARSKPDIHCRTCKKPLQLGHQLQPGVAVETIPLFQRSRNAG